MSYVVFLGHLANVLIFNKQFFKINALKFGYFGYYYYLYYVIKMINMNLSIRELNELIYSLGIAAHHGNFVNKEVNESLLDRVYCELDKKIAEREAEEEADFLSIIEQDSHFVSNEEADEDANQSKKERGWIVQKMLDYVDYCGAVSHTQLENYYKAITKSNSFSHCLINLRTPYKNRKTQRYLAKEGKKYSDAKYVVKVANPSNWVVAEK